MEDFKLETAKSQRVPRANLLDEKKISAKVSGKVLGAKKTFTGLRTVP